MKCKCSLERVVLPTEEKQYASLACRITAMILYKMQKLEKISGGFQHQGGFMDDPGEQTRMRSVLCIMKYNYVVIKCDLLKSRNTVPLAHVIF